MMMTTTRDSNDMAFKTVWGYKIILPMLMLLAVTSCSTTSKVPDGDQLFIGLEDIKYKEDSLTAQKGNAAHATTTKEELEAALVTAPNGALFGSSKFRTIPYALWIWNAFSEKPDKLSKWITRTFGKAPVLMSWVNPELRAQVAQGVLRNNGYMHAAVSHERVQTGNPKKSKIRYDVYMGPLMVIDTVEYTNFLYEADSLLKARRKDAVIKRGTPMAVSLLDQERTRITTLFRNNGFYFYQQGYASFLADTTEMPGRARLRLQMADSIPPAASRKWYIGNINVDMVKKFGDKINNEVGNQVFTFRFHGKKPPLRPRVLMKYLRLRPKQMYSYRRYTNSMNKLNGTELFSMLQMGFTPRDSSATCDTLDVNLQCVFNKPYDFYIETNYKNKINGRTGPELVLGFTKRNAFRGGEKLDLNLHGSYEWQTGGKLKGSSSEVNSYEYGADASLEFPRLLIPFLKDTEFFNTPTTRAKASLNVLNRPGYFRMHTATGEWLYTWQRRRQHRHELSPLTLQYQRLNYRTQKFDSIMTENPYLMATMEDVLIPKMRYTYTYSSPRRHTNPVRWETTLTEAGNIVSLGYLAAGKKWDEEGKTMFKNSYAQFVKLETDITKKWQLDMKSQLVAHVGAGVIYAFGNTTSAPYSEQFYVGGANSIRAFTVRTIGPGSYSTDVKRLSYLDQTGDIKLQANLEYRFNMFGNLYGAAFLDAGNVWAIRDDGYRQGAQFKAKNFLKEMALGTGIGVRYDLDFLILRLDWGIGLHVPYDTGKGGFYNIKKFSDAQSIHLAVGYPF